MTVRKGAARNQIQVRRSSRGPRRATSHGTAHRDPQRHLCDSGIGHVNAGSRVNDMTRPTPEWLRMDDQVSGHAVEETFQPELEAGLAMEVQGDEELSPELPVRIASLPGPFRLAHADSLP